MVSDLPIPYFEDQKEWSCSTCTLINHPLFHMCELCETLRMTKESEHAPTGSEPVISEGSQHSSELESGHFDDQVAKSTVTGGIEQKHASTGDDHAIPQGSQDRSYSEPRQFDDQVTKASVRGKDKQEFRLVLLGMTGAGKSATGNTILNEECFKSEACQESVTEECSYHQRDRYDKSVLLVDTPGLLDTKMEKEKVSKEIKKCIGLSAPGPHAFLLVTSTYHRFTDEAASVFNEIDDMFGANMKNYVIVISTGKDNLPSSQSFQEYADKSPPKLKEILLSAGGGYMAFGNRGKHEDRENDVKALFHRVDEMVKKNRESHFTSGMFEEAERIMQESIPKALQEEDRRQKVQQSLEQAEKKLKKEIQYYQNLNKENEANLPKLQIELDTPKKNKSKKRYFSESERELGELVKQEAEKLQLKKKLIEQIKKVDGDEKVEIEQQLAEVRQEINKIYAEKQRVEEEVAKEIMAVMVREEERNKIEKEDEGAFRRLIQRLKKGGFRFLKFFK